MKLLALVFSFVAVTFLWADEESSGTKTIEKSSKVIVINEPDSKRDRPKVVVESGEDVIAGEPQENMKAAYRAWDNQCKEWKAEIKSLNSGNLLYVSCGAAKRETEMVQSQKWYVYRSTGKFKIKVVGK